MKVVLAGGSGFIGKHLAQLFSSHGGYEVITLSRSTGPGKVQWDAKTVGDWWKELDGADAVINLTGETISQKFTPETKARIRSSRLDSTQAIHNAIQKCETKPFWINASAVGYYGSAGNTILDESSQPGTGFLADLCQEWEALPNQTENTAIIRIGIVLHPDGGALKPLDTLTRSFLGGHAGTGQQWMPWIHIDDLCEMIFWIAQNKLNGPFNLCAPNPVTNADFMQTLRKVRNRPYSPPVPSFMLNLIGQTIGPDSSLILNSLRCIPKHAQDIGFEFRFPKLADSLPNLLL